MSELKNLVCTSSDIRFPEQVKRIRADLNILGYDADEQTIQRAYEEWSEDYWASSWDDYSGQVDRLDMLLADYLKVSPASTPKLPRVSPNDLVEGEWYAFNYHQKFIPMLGKAEIFQGKFRIVDSFN